MYLCHCKMCNSEPSNRTMHMTKDDRYINAALVDVVCVFVCFYVGFSTECFFHCIWYVCYCAICCHCFRLILSVPFCKQRPSSSIRSMSMWVDTFIGMVSWPLDTVWKIRKPCADNEMCTMLFHIQRLCAHCAYGNHTLPVRFIYKLYGYKSNMRFMTSHFKVIT